MAQLGRCGLPEFELPIASLFHPDGTDVLVTRRVLVVVDHAHDDVVSDHSGAVVYGNDLGIVDAVFLSIVGNNVGKNVGFGLGFAVIADGDEVVGDGVVHVIAIVVLLGIGEFLFDIEELPRERRFGVVSRRCQGRKGQGDQEQGCE